jgi:hypothetical protein
MEEIRCKQNGWLPRLDGSRGALGGQSAEKVSKAIFTTAGTSTFSAYRQLLQLISIAQK